MTRDRSSGRRADVAVVGGGLVGCLVARAAAAEGFGVVLLEADGELAGGASRAAAGMLAPQMERAEGRLPGDAALDGLCRTARASYPAFAAALERETGREVGYDGAGTLVVGLEPAAVEGLREAGRAQRAAGLEAEWLDAPRARALEPTLGPAVAGALLLPDDHSVDNVALARAAAAAVWADPRIEVRPRSPVEAVRIAGGRVAGVELVGGGGLAADRVVVAAGAWSGRIGGLPRRLAVGPVKGQMVAVVPASRPGRTVAGPGAYCVPRSDGRVLIGATSERAGFDLGVDPAAVDRLVGAAARWIPALGTGPRLPGWAGLRPGTPDDRPVLGPDPDVGGLVYATGHHRNGILLAPLTADCVAALLAGRAPPVDLAPFAPDRPAVVGPVT